MDYTQKLTAFLRIASQLVNRFEQLAPDVDGKIDPTDVRLIKAFRAKRDELSRQTLQGAEPARKSRNKR
jgi:hypothetical protein